MFDIKDLISKDISFVVDHCQLAEAVRLLCTSDQFLLPVVNQCLEPVGILTEKDVLAWLCNGRNKNAEVVDCMQTEFITLDDKTGLIDMMCIFARENHREILVVSDGVLTGLIKRGNIIKYLIDKRTAASGRVEKKTECNT
jgi:predicted transcriptional regulator